MFYSGMPQTICANNGVAILVANNWKFKLNIFRSERIKNNFKTNVYRIHTITGIFVLKNKKIVEIENSMTNYKQNLIKLLGRNMLQSVVFFNARVEKLAIPNIIDEFGEEALNKNGQELRLFNDQ